MTEDSMIHKIAAGNQKALELAMEKYSGYVAAVIRGRGRGILTQEDVEELTADVFLSLWQSAETIRSKHLKQWLGAVARNKVIERLRAWKITISLDEEFLVLDDGLWQALRQNEREALVNAALSALPSVDREIMQRFYLLCQSTGEIAAALNINESTVRTKLSRGRKKMKHELTERGYCIEDFL